MSLVTLLCICILLIDTVLVLARIILLKSLRERAAALLVHAQVLSRIAGKFPYSDWATPFQQLKEVVDGLPPRLPQNGPFSKDLQDMVALCLDKEYRHRPKYQKLLSHPFLKTCASFTYILT